MGNTFSKKVENNAEIWKQSARNTKIACALSVLLTLWKYRKPLFKLYSKKKKKDGKNDGQTLYSLCWSMLKYFLKFPIFIATFSVFFKKLIRMNYLSSALDINMDSLIIQKYSIAFMAFLLAHYIQQNVNVFHWKWSLFLLIRSLYSLLRLSIPSEYQILSIEDVHSITFPILGCILVCFCSASLPSSVVSTYDAVLYYNPKQYISYFGSHHKKMPSCTSTVSFHEKENKHKSCLYAMISDAIFVKIPHCASFFVKLHFVAQLLGGKRFIKNVKSKPMTVVFDILRNTSRSCGYWMGVHLCIRICSCFSRTWIIKIHAILDRIFGINTKTHTQNKNKNCIHEWDCESSIYLRLILTMLIGRYNILFEPKGRRTEITLSLVWYILTSLFRISCDLRTSDDDKYHWLLGSNQFVSFLFSLCVAINTYVYCKDSSYLKSMERNIIQNFLIQ